MEWIVVFLIHLPRLWLCVLLHKLRLLSLSLSKTTSTLETSHIGRLLIKTASILKPYISQIGLLLPKIAPILSTICHIGLLLPKIVPILTVPTVKICRLLPKIVSILRHSGFQICRLLTLVSISVWMDVRFLLIISFIVSISSVRINRLLLKATVIDAPAAAEICWLLPKKLTLRICIWSFRFLLNLYFRRRFIGKDLCNVNWGFWEFITFPNAFYHLDSGILQIAIYDIHAAHNRDLQNGVFDVECVAVPGYVDFQVRLEDVYGVHIT